MRTSPIGQIGSIAWIVPHDLRHNGKTISFTGLLELLDPIRFQMSVPALGQRVNTC